MSELQEVFREAARREFAHIPAEQELQWDFSPRFQRKMRRLIRANTYGYWNLINTAAKRTAIAAALIVLLLTSVMAIKPIRQRVIQFFVEVYEEYFEVRFGEEEKDDINPTVVPMTRYTLTKLPDGYEEVEYMELDILLWTVWKNEDGNQISLQQEPGTQEITLDNIDGETDTFKHGSLDVVYQNHEGTHMFIWEKDGYVFYLTFFEKLNMEESLMMIDSLEKVKK